METGIMKKFFSVFLAFSICVLTLTGAIPGGALDVLTFYEDSLTVTLDLGSGVLRVSGSGEMKNYSADAAAPWYSYKNNYTSVIIEPGVTSVGDYSFYSSFNLKTLSLPEGLEYIGRYAFGSCPNLESVYIPDSVKDLGAYAFTGCTHLRSARLPRVLENGIPDGLFLLSSYLADVEMPEVCPVIGESAFSSCAYIKSVKLPEDLEIIKKFAFGSCTALAEINFPEGLSYIGERSFYGTALKNPVFPETLEYIGAAAFLNSSWYRSLPDGINLVNGITLTYKGTPAGKTVEIPDGTRVISPMTLNGQNFVTEVIIPDTVEVICDHAFYDISSMYSVSVPDSVREIGEYAFGYVKSLYGEIEAPLMPFTLYGHGGGTAEKYADDNGFDFVCDHEEGIYLYHPNCMTGGEAILGCKWCGEETSRVNMRRSLHTYGPVLERAAGCTEGEMRWQECVDCKYVNVLSEGKPLGHTLPDSYTVDSYPTCTEDGYLSRHCEVCGEKCDVLVIEKTGHKPSDKTETVKEPTCTEAGLCVIYCAVCGEEVAKEEIPATGHRYTGDLTVLIPSDTRRLVKGLRVMECLNCGRVTYYEYFLAGDMDGDGIISQRDSLIIKRYLGGAYQDTSKIIVRNGDMNYDGKINAVDLMLFKEAIE